MTFADFFRTATRSEKESNGRTPYRFQARFAEDAALYDIVRAPTGSGKTATAVLGWLYRRRYHPDTAVQRATPRRLVYCLPMRTLVEQTVKNAQAWLGQLDLGKEIGVHKLLGGETDNDWTLYPERDAILVGTQDMLLSRALNRGYAASRFRWPIDFGLLNNDCLWVFDELQLMANGVATSAQLAGLRTKLETFGPCPSVWMSATMERSWLGTVDWRERIDSLHELRLDDDELTTGDLGKRMTAKKTLRPANLGTDAADKKDYPKVVAKAVAAAHGAANRSLTLVVLNTVDRAKAVFEALQKLKLPADLRLIHSRFRPPERATLNDCLSAELPENGRIVVATQVVEAGVDISARVLFTELAPWPSMVQRFGRCHRYGELPNGGEIFWLDLPDPKTALPYLADDLVTSRKLLEKLAGQDVSPASLERFQKDNGVTLPFEHKHVVRRRDVLDLFDTMPDLSGNDIDVSRFVRGDDKETDVQVYWREGQPEKDPDAKTRRNQAPRREELCNVPIGDFKKFLEAENAAYRWDFLDEQWQTLGKRDAGSIIPGQVFWVPTDEGGYDQLKGWDATTASRVPVVPPPEFISDDERKQRQDTAYDSDDWSHFDWRSIASHTNEVTTELDRILKPDVQLTLSENEQTVLRTVIQWHDWGKAHDVFQSAIKAEAEVADTKGPKGAKKKVLRPSKWAGHEYVAKAPDEFWGKSYRNIGNERRTRVSRFRHELASALGVLALYRDGQMPADWQRLSPQEQDLALYLIAAHHGKVRLSVRVMPNEKPVPTDPAKTRFAAGVWDGDELPATDLGNGTMTTAVGIDLSPMLLGDGSWTARMLAVRDRLNPFRLAYLEAIVRAADCRASAQAGGTKEDGDA